jgi:hypothetical protein
MKYMAGLCFGFAIGMMFINLVLREHSTMYKQGFEAGKLYVRNCMLQQNDSILGCGKAGYIPDTISVKTELKNGGSYNINK